MRISLILTVKKSVVADWTILGTNSQNLNFFLTCLDRKKVILYLWTNLIETILLLFCALLMLVSLFFVHKELFSIIFTCLNMLSFLKVFLSKTTSKI